VDGITFYEVSPMSITCPGLFKKEAMRQEAPLLPIFPEGYEEVSSLDAGSQVVPGLLGRVMRPFYDFA